MDNEELLQKYKFVKLRAQMEKAFLESANIVKEEDKMKGEYINEINFGKRIEKVSLKAF